MRTRPTRALSMIESMPWNKNVMVVLAHDRTQPATTRLETTREWQLWQLRRCHKSVITKLKCNVNVTVRAALKTAPSGRTGPGPVRPWSYWYTTGDERLVGPNIITIVPLRPLQCHFGGTQESGSEYVRIHAADRTVACNPGDAPNSTTLGSTTTSQADNIIDIRI